MHKLDAVAVSVCLGVGSILSTSAVTATPAPVTAPAGPTLTPGAKVFDSEGAELGTIEAVSGQNVVLVIGAHKVTIQAQAFAQTSKGPAISMTKAQVVAAAEKAAGESAAALAAALQPGADVRSARGSAVLGKIETIDAEMVVLTTSGGNVRLPRTAFFMSPAGLATGFSAAQFRDAVKQATTPQPATGNP